MWLPAAHGCMSGSVPGHAQELPELCALTRQSIVALPSFSRVMTACGIAHDRVTFAKGPFAERYGTRDGHARREGTTAHQRRQLGNPWPIDLTPANVRLLEAELQGTCAWSLERLKRRSVALSQAHAPSPLPFHGHRRRPAG